MINASGNVVQRGNPMKYRVAAFVGLAILLSLSALLLFATQALYLGSVATVVHIGLRFTNSVIALIMLASVILFFRQQTRLAIYIGLASLIAAFLSVVISDAVNRPLLDWQRDRQAHGFRQNVLQNHQPRVSCEGSRIYAVPRHRDGRTLYWVAPESVWVEPRSFASFTVFEKSRRCEIYLPETSTILMQIEERFSRCGAGKLAEIERLIEELKALPCPYADVSIRP